MYAVKDNNRIEKAATQRNVKDIKAHKTKKLITRKVDAHHSGQGQ